jgi:serine/threonine protein kinase
MSSLIGQSLGRYQILEQLGEGGMATVYKAFDTRLERYVAIKVIRTEQFPPVMLDQMMKRFEREARALAKLSHPNIVHVHDYGEYEGTPYLVMEFLPCGTLKHTSGTPMPWQEALYILLPIAHALAYAHEHNIIHRDIKPGNILLTEKGQPMLSDFGIAKILENEEAGTLTGTGMSIGTPEYMAPEQWTGEAGPRSDIYSLGVVLYELVIGRTPYTADTPAAIMLKQVTDPLPRPRQFVPDLPEELEMVLLKALAKKPEDRYQSMSEFASALEGLTGGRTLLAVEKGKDSQSDKTVLVGAGRQQGGESTPGVPIPPEKPRTTRKWGRWIPVGVLMVLLCIGLVAGGVWVMRSLRGAVPITVSATPTIAPTQLIPSTLTVPVGVLPTTAPAITLTPLPSEIKVLWDISHGPRKSEDGSLYTPDGMYKSLVQALAKDKFAISSGDLTNLNSYDIFVLSETSAATTPYTSAEADQIEKFVRTSGHGLLILSDIPAFENLADPVSRRFSIGLGEAISNGPVSYSNEPFFSGVTSLQFLFGGGVLQVSPPSLPAATDLDGNPVIAFCECDAGRVMVISDANLWDNRGVSQADNQRFAANVFRWLAKIAP